MVTLQAEAMKELVAGGQTSDMASEQERDRLLLR